MSARDTTHQFAQRSNTIIHSFNRVAFVPEVATVRGLAVLAYRNSRCPCYSVQRQFKFDQGLATGSPCGSCYRCDGSRAFGLAKPPLSSPANTSRGKTYRFPASALQIEAARRVGRSAALHNSLVHSAASLSAAMLRVQTHRLLVHHSLASIAGAYRLPPLCLQVRCTPRLTVHSPSGALTPDGTVSISS